MTAKFDPGQVVGTPAALRLLTASGVEPKVLLDRHVSGDWGDLDDDDKLVNERALVNGERVLSSYTVGSGTVWVITEWDRSVTTILLPEEY